ncbi:hypothetical protein MGG_15603 [Pyricularia oryzae 70-15]|uniref:Uncharacterized protein n=1 Tax=Pyricularia oryzae (strain 70-15 / ATCC MYA-4617 / FGSC 8958) TaxID=242507 RepID=G4MVK0_PYRO7|nr:uncharacterized protein MGG_15603 [Pyricularia oryzae 70-15]EHA54109.1 hypothetical protein MGG_15603 [Pyricularia oryzae 70-15]KAI7930903.1 hypothetical protein M9X92_000583 [Pyricularia oryzae]KAI7932451.1 hypothetical protein M0657_000581 [Pyricularia oryzae]
MQFLVRRGVAGFLDESTRHQSITRQGLEPGVGAFFAARIKASETGDTPPKARR